MSAGGHWSPNGNWVPEKQRETPWREHPNFKWSDQNQSQPPPPVSTYQQPLAITYQQPPAITYQQQPAISYPQQHEEQPQWQNRNHEGQNNWNNNRGQENQPHWQNMNQNNQMVSYVPPHQRSYQNQNSSVPSQQQGNQ
ncbi:putative uncharacterized protein DDB_G0288537 [Salvia splendens]|uniref:putative uncharacterized protein DDB_G0288537 n=1 Tax=Salvia splendens TaxID=180675 RepID=UPI001C259862|nr:putative uncharacterized protein DDB_G0288537 [Salvia splendens]